MKKRLVVLTGAGMSAESGIKTFRGGDGLWDNYKIEDVCTDEAWERNPTLVNEFYNIRRRELNRVSPNSGHIGLADLEETFDVNIITQNVDDLHERAGSKNVLHLHGELRKVRSSKNPDYIYELEGTDVMPGERCDDGSLVRPHIVFFGEGVPNFELATDIVKRADILVIIGTSLNVYPAAYLYKYAPASTPIYLIDPVVPEAAKSTNINVIQKNATEGVAELKETLMEIWK